MWAFFAAQMYIDVYIADKLNIICGENCQEILIHTRIQFYATDMNKNEIMK